MTKQQILDRLKQITELQMDKLNALGENITTQQEEELKLYNRAFNRYLWDYLRYDSKRASTQPISIEARRNRADIRADAR